MDKPNLLKPIGAIVIVVIVVIVIIALPKKTAAPVETSTADTSAVPAVTKETDGSASADASATSTSQAPSSTYKDGTYSATGSYISPGGPDSVLVKVTLKDDVIVDSEVVGQPGDNTSKKYQGIFIANYKALITGKNIDEVELHKVSGSSLTSGGFNAALDKIKVEAKA